MGRMKACTLTLAMALSGCTNANLGRRSSSPLPPANLEAVPPETLVAGTTSKWVRRVLPFSNAAGAALVPAGDSSILLVVDRGLARSTDLGRTWEIVPVSSTETLYTNDGGGRFVDLATARRAWFLEPIVDETFQTIATTLAGVRLYVLARGASTHRLSSMPIAPGGGRSFHRIFSADGPENACLVSTGSRVFVGCVIGRRPVLLESKNEGREWARAWRGKVEAGSPVAMTFLEPNRGILLSADGSLLRTVDGCETWLAAGALPLDCADDAKAMGWADDRVGYVVGRGGMIVVTSDGGRTWTRGRSTSLADLNAVRVVSADEAWVVGSAGTILRTQNGGSTWTRVDPGIGEDVRSIVSFEHAVWIVGDGSLWVFSLDDYATQVNASVD
jgi:hypothetical protein